MKTSSIIISAVVFLILSFGVWYFVDAKIFVAQSFTDTEAGFEDAQDAVMEQEVLLPDMLPDEIPQTRGARWAYYWKEFTPAEQRVYGIVNRNAEPLRVGIQVGHWKNSEVPEELDGLKRNGGGASGGGKTEVDTVLVIARKVQVLLESKGVVVDLIPATVPPDYLADAFVSIHADGNANPSVSGFKIASPQRDFSGKSLSLVEELNSAYAKETKLAQDSNITRRMSGYYAFNWRRYVHTVHPMTPAVIVETGFMTSPTDRTVIVTNPDKSARGIANGIINFLQKNYPDRVFLD